MKIGVIGPTFSPPKKLIETVKKIEMKGYDSVWWPDHLMGWYPQSIWKPEITNVAKYQKSPHVFFEASATISFVSSQTNKIILGLSVTDAIRRNPAYLLQTAVTLSYFSNGRFILGLGAGEAENITPYGLNYSKQVSKLEEALKIIKLLKNSGTGEKIYFKGKFWKLEDAVFDLQPHNNKHPPIWIGGQGEKMLLITGKYGDGWLPVDLTVEEYKEKLKKVLRYASKNGRKEEEITKALFISVIIDKNNEECLKIMDSPLIKAKALIYPAYVYEKHGYQHPLGRNFYGLRDYIPSKLSEKEALKAINLVPKEVLEERYVYGSPEEVINKLAWYKKAGVEHVVLWNETFFGDYRKVKTSYHYLTQVLNYFKEN